LCCGHAARQEPEPTPEIVREMAVVAALPFWSTLRNRPAAQAAMRGANAAVVGILSAHNNGAD
jgi:hypothetical protein